jgi:hypothetical protein
MKNLDWLHRRLMPAMALVVAACTSGPPPIPPPAREQVRPIALEESGLACLDLAPEIVAAHHERAPMFGASSCDTRALDYAGAFGLIGAIAALGVASSCMGPEDGFYVDVAATVRDRFVQSLSPQAVTSRIEAPVACPASDAVTALRQSFGDRPVIDFKTVDWQKTTAGGFPVFVPLTVRGRLVDVKNGQVLWEEACTIAPDSVPENMDATRSTLEQSAARCAEQFAEQFAKARPTA